MKASTLVIILSSILLLTACPRNQGRMPEVLARRVITYETSRFDQDLAAYESADITTKRLIRDEMLLRLKRNIDALYHDFERDLFIHRATSNILADFTELATAGATSITNGERAKTILAVALTAFKGGRKSIDQNLFRERTTEILISRMRASRSRIEAEITESRPAGADVYTLDDALGHLVDYFYAGTLQNALQELAQQAGKEADEARQAADDKEDERISTEIQASFDASVQLRQILRQLQTDIRSKDQARINAAQKRLLKALNTLNPTLFNNQLKVSESNTAQELLDKLVAGLRAGNRQGGVINRGMLKTEQVLEALKP